MSVTSVGRWLTCVQAKWVLSSLNRQHEGGEQSSFPASSPGGGPAALTTTRNTPTSIYSVSPSKDDRIEASTARISGQEERMELMEDMITALAYTLKVPSLHPLPPRGTGLRSYSSHLSTLCTLACCPRRARALYCAV